MVSSLLNNGDDSIISYNTGYGWGIGSRVRIGREAWKGLHLGHGLNCSIKEGRATVLLSAKALESRNGHGNFFYSTVTFGITSCTDRMGIMLLYGSTESFLCALLGLKRGGFLPQRVSITWHGIVLLYYAMILLYLESLP